MRVVLSVCGGCSREDAALVCVLVRAALCVLEYAFYLPSEDILVVPHNFKGLFASVNGMMVRFRLRVGRLAVRTEECMSMRVLTKKMCVCVCVSGSRRRLSEVPTGPPAYERPHPCTHALQQSPTKVKYRFLFTQHGEKTSSSSAVIPTRRYPPCSHLACYLVFPVTC